MGRNVHFCVIEDGEEICGSRLDQLLAQHFFYRLAFDGLFPTRLSGTLINLLYHVRHEAPCVAHKTADHRP
jgi:hypothetical protein